MTANTTYGPKVTVTRSCSDCPACETKQYREQGDSGTDWTCAHPSLEKPRYIGIFSTTPDWCPVASPSAQPSGAPEVQRGIASYLSAQWLAERFHSIYERLAPAFGYETRADTRTFDRQSANGRLMVAVCQELLATAPTPSGAPADTTNHGNNSMTDPKLTEFLEACLSARGWFEGNPDAALHEIETRAAALAGAPAVQGWRPIETAPKDNKPFLAWYPQVRLDDDDNMTDEVFGGAAAIISLDGKVWDEPEWLSAHGTYFMEDWCFAELPTHWMPLPVPPAALTPLAVQDATPMKGQQQ